MKALIPILILTSLTILISCDTDETIHQEESITSSALIITTVQAETTGDHNSNSNRSFNASIEAINLEHTLQWVSYTTANVIYNNTEAKNKFLNRINYTPFIINSGTVIDIEELIGSNVPNDDPFKVAFKNHLITLVSLFYVSGCPLGSSESPEPPLNTGEGGNGRPVMLSSNRGFSTSVPTLSDIEVMVNAFIAYIISDECIELYLPIGITENFDEITSSAHPMNTNVMNNGYFTRPYTGCSNMEYETVDVTVNSNYTQNANGPVVIARPIKSRSCSYINFNFDFTNFLN